MIPFTLQQLRLFKVVAIEQNFTVAAKTLYLSQPTLSKQIKKLEINLGILLFKRQNNRIYLTENGKLFLRYTDRILALCEESCRLTITDNYKERSCLKIGASLNIATYLLPKLLILSNQKYVNQLFSSSEVSFQLLKAIKENLICEKLIG